MGKVKTTVTEIRYRNFAILYDEFCDSVFKLNPGAPMKGMLKAFAEQMGMSDRYLSHVKCNRKPVGHTVARKIEAGCGKPVGWMDVDHDALANSLAVGAKSQREREFVQMAMEIYKANPEGAQAAMTRMLIDMLKKSA